MGWGWRCTDKLVGLSVRVGVEVDILDMGKRNKGGKGANVFEDMTAPGHGELTLWPGEKHVLISRACISSELRHLSCASGGVRKCKSI